MTSAGALTEFRTGPLYFFDQPVKRNKSKGTRSIWYCAPDGGAQEEGAESSRENDNKQGKRAELGSSLSGEPLNIEPPDRMDTYRRAAPRLLDELSRLLSQHKWSEKHCVPRGLVNILNCSWHELTAGVLHSPEQADKQPNQSKGGLTLDEPRQVSASDRKEEAGQRNPKREPPESKQSYKAHNSTSSSFSLSSSCKHPGWLVLPQQLSSDDPQCISLSQWVEERLQVARDPEKLQTAEQDPMEPLLLRHYGDAKARVENRRGRRKAQSSTSVDGTRQISGVKQRDRQKLHYRIDDGSSFIYYPSGCMAVCQSHSGLPCGGYYTNVFSDADTPLILATITAFGHGSVTHHLSSTITAVWDQGGGVKYDPRGNTTKEWSWPTGRTPREKIVIQVSDFISVRLRSGTSATLSFKCANKSVQLPLSALPNQLKDTVSVCSWEAVQMGREVERPEEPLAQWRRGGRADRELKRHRQRARNTVDNWLDCYRVAIGIKCPHMKRMPDAPLRTRLKREVQPAALPSLNPPVRADVKPAQPTKEDRSGLQVLHRHLTAAAEQTLDPQVKLPRTPKKRSKEEPRVTQIGPLKIYGNIEPESVIIPGSPDLQPSAVTLSPAPPPFAPSIPLTVCPALLRAALLGEEGRRRCCCSTTLMPVVTDLEYDAFIMGQPAHSQQILVVCVTVSRQYVSTHAETDQDEPEQLYSGNNKHRTAPCSQCQTDSFRLVRYEVSPGKLSCGEENILLQRRHNAAPGMVLMYIRGKLLFVGHMFAGQGRSVGALQKQISKTRGDYRLGVNLPSDYKLSDAVTSPTNTQNSPVTSLEGEHDKTASMGKEQSTERQKMIKFPH